MEVHKEKVMKIERGCPTVTLKDIECGECFMYKDDVYIKLSMFINDEESGGYDTCVNLSDGKPLSLGLATMVTPVDAKVVIE